MIFKFHLSVFGVPNFPALFFERKRRVDDKVAGVVNAEGVENGKEVFQSRKEFAVRGLFYASTLFRASFQAGIHLKVQLFFVGYPLRPKRAFHALYVFCGAFSYPVLQNVEFICVFKGHVLIAHIKIKALKFADKGFSAGAQVFFHVSVVRVSIILTHYACVRVRFGVKGVVPAYERFSLAFQVVRYAFVKIKLQIFFVFQSFAFYLCLAVRALFPLVFGSLVAAYVEIFGREKLR